MAISKKKSIKTTILIIIFIGVLLPIIALIFVSGAQYKRQSEEIAKNQAISLANQYSVKIEKSLNELFTSTNVFADMQTATITDSGISAYTAEQLQKNNIEILKKNEQALAFYTILMPGHIINPSTGELNQNLSLIGNTHYKSNISSLVMWNYSFKSNIPDTLTKGGGYMLIPPYFDVYDKDSLLMITYGHQIEHNNEIIGLVGADISIDWMQDFISTSEIFNNTAEITIISNLGIINANNKDKSYVGKNIKQVLDSFENERSYLFSDEASNIRNGGYYVFYEPIKLGKLKDAWHIRISVPKDEILGDANTNLLIRILIAIVIALISLFVTSYYFNSIIKRIMLLGSVAKQMAKGNLFIDFKIVGSDEITDLGRSLQAIIIRFSDIIKGIKATMEQLQASGNALSNTAIKLSEGASEQASSTEEVSASMEQMSANIEQNAENAKSANIIAKRSSEEIEVGSKSVKSTANSMGDIAKKTSIIGDIAFQVNILALNAAVEAARAGVHGRGFGVVANEVGKLADRSKIAASEIDELTNRSFSIAKKSGLSLEQIVPEIQKTALLIEEITNASIEQKAGADQINNAIQQLSNVTQQNASSAEQLATNVESLTMLADKLNDLIAFFKFDVSQESSVEEKSLTEQKKKIESTSVPITKEKNKKIEEIQKPAESKAEAPNKKIIDKGFDLDLGGGDKLDDGFERF